MESRTVGAIVLGPRNLTGRYNFMLLESGQQIDGRVVGQFPISNEVIARVEQLGREQRQPYGQSQRLMYEWRPGTPVADDDVMEAHVDPPMIVPEPIVTSKPQDGPFPPQGADVNMVPPLLILQSEEVNRDHFENKGAREESASPTTTQFDHAPTTTFQRDQTVSNDKNQGAATDLGEIGKEENFGEGEILFQNEEEEMLYEVEEEGAEETDDDDVVQVTDDESTHEQEEMKASTDEDKQRRGSHWDSGPGYGRGMRNKNKATKRYGLDLLQTKLRLKKEKEKKAETEGERPKKSYAFLQKSFTDLEEEEKHEYFGEVWKELKLTGKTEMMERFTTGLVFAQMLVNKGIKLYGREAELKLMAEFAQLLEYQVFHGLDAKKLSLKQKKGAANMISIIEEKFNRGHTPENPEIKARSVFNGAVQKGLYSKEETASPTVCIDSFFILCLINALEGRDKAITDVKGAYLNARMKDLVIMKIIGREAELFCELDPNLTKFLTEEKGKKVLYVQLDRALYGCVKSALLWYETYSGTLSELGFILNPYDLCVANADINGKQCTICWYVDDNMISHMDPEVVDDVIKKIEEKYGKMSQTRGDEQEFLGMKIKFKKGRFSVSMKKHIKKAFNLFSEEVTRKAATPAKSYLFEVRADSAPLDEERAENFHSVVALLLFILRRCRLDIQTAIGFLSTRVSCPDEDDWVKLRRIMQYLNGTMDLVLTLGADDIRKMKTWVDVSYGVHADSRSHTGGCASFGWGVLMTMCKKQKLNVKSSTEGEVVGVSDYLPTTIWGRMFLEAQGYGLIENVLFQDNMSAMKLEKNGTLPPIPPDPRIVPNYPSFEPAPATIPPADTSNIEEASRTHTLNSEEEDNFSAEGRSILIDPYSNQSPSGSSNNNCVDCVSSSSSSSTVKSAFVARRTVPSSTKKKAPPPSEPPSEVTFSVTKQPVPKTQAPPAAEKSLAWKEQLTPQKQKIGVESDPSEKNQKQPKMADNPYVDVYVDGNKQKSAVAYGCQDFETDIAYCQQCSAVVKLPVVEGPGRSQSHTDHIDKI